MIKKFNIQHGLAGFVSVACQPVLIEFVQQDGTFVQEIDDPDGGIYNPACEMISVPIFCTADIENANDANDYLTRYPRLVVQLINKKPDRAFMETQTKDPKIAQMVSRNWKLNEQDIAKLMTFVPVIGRVHQIMGKIEQLHNMKHHSKDLMDVAYTLGYQMEVSATQFRNIEKDLYSFNKVLNKQMVNQTTVTGYLNDSIEHTERTFNK